MNKEKRALAYLILSPYYVVCLLIIITLSPALIMIFMSEVMDWAWEVLEERKGK
jgi:hypothetical protein